MSSYPSCPRCGRKAKKAAFSNWFPVYTCRKCGEKYCSDCGRGSGITCPECGSTEYSQYDKVYSE